MRSRALRTIEHAAVATAQPRTGENRAVGGARRLMHQGGQIGQGFQLSFTQRFVQCRSLAILPDGAEERGRLQVDRDFVRMEIESILLK